MNDKFVTAILASDVNGGISRNGKIPWNIPKDMEHFRKTTIGKGNNSVIMGRTTWDSLPEQYRPLKQRCNVVLTRNNEFEAPSPVYTVYSVEQAMSVVDNSDEVFIIGGAEIYKQFFNNPKCSTILRTSILEDFDCDTFVKIPEDKFNKVECNFLHSHNGIGFCFEKWERFNQ